MGALGEHTSLADRKHRAGQRLIVGLAGPGLTDDERALVRAIQPAGFILFARNVEEPAQVRELHRELVALVDPHHPPLLSVDQEGGRVQRVRITRWPALRTVGNVGDVEQTRAVARALGQELRAMGFNLDWAPVADVDSNPKNPVIGDRSFAREAALVGRHVRAFLDGLHEVGIIGCVKHFPGHGDTTVDSHLDLPVVDKDEGDIRQVELAPFRDAIAHGVGVVMTAHVLFPALDPDVPATMSSRILRGILRDELRFPGVITSDDMEMKAVRGRYPLEQQLDLACRATVDTFLCCKSPELQWEAWETLIRLQEQDKAHDSLSEDSARRVMVLRERFLPREDAPPPLAIVGSEAHKLLAAMIEARGQA